MGSGRLRSAKGVAVPDFQSIMRPLLAAYGSGQERPIAEVRLELAREFALTDIELAERLPSGTAKTFPNRVGWAAWSSPALAC